MSVILSVARPLYTLARCYHGTPIGRRVARWQRTHALRRFLARVRATVRTHGLCVRPAAWCEGDGLFVGASPGCGVPKAGVVLGVCPGELTNDACAPSLNGAYLMHFPYLLLLQAKAEKASLRTMLLDGRPPPAAPQKKDAWNLSHANHSCRRFNCALAAVRVGWGTVLVLRSLRPIAAGEELLMDYDAGSDETGHPYWQTEAFPGEAKDTRETRVMRCACEGALCPRRRYRREPRASQ